MRFKILAVRTVFQYLRTLQKFIKVYDYLQLVTMPIEIDEFETQPSEILEIDEDTQAYKVLKFLAENSDKAFTHKEIHEELGIKKGSIGTVLSRLEEQNLVRHKGKYWAIIEDDRLASFTAMTQGSSTSVQDDYFGEDQ